MTDMRDEAALQFHTLTRKAIMEAGLVQCNDPYALHYEQLRRHILAEATADEALLEDAGIEISEGWLLEQYQHTSDCAAYLDDFEFMRHLNANGELDKPLDDSVVGALARHDVFFALARYENDLAAFLFSSKAAAAGWTHDQALLSGLRATLAANKAYEFALRLKAKHAIETACRLRRH